MKMYVCILGEGRFLTSVLYVGEFSILSPKKIKGDLEGKVIIFEGDIIGHCGIK
jgi:hypothetical protein